MLSKVLGSLSRRGCLTALALAACSGLAVAQPVEAEVVEKSPFTVSMGLDAQSHFVSYGFDVWGGGNRPSPFTSDSTVNAYSTVTMAVADNVSVYLNVWGDINNNAPQTLGGDIQEIDVNTGITYTMDAFSFTLAHGFWDYAGDEERIVDFTIAFADGDMITRTDAFSLNPNIVFHWRYDGNGAQDTGLAVVPGIRPTFTLMGDSTYPVTLAVPVNFALFTNDFQGGDSGFGFFSAGVVASVPLSFIDADKYGAWTASAGLTYWHTPDDTIPGNPDENFFSSFISIGLSF